MAARRRKTETALSPAPSVAGNATPRVVVEVHDLEQGKQLVGLRSPGQHGTAYKALPEQLTFDKKD
jgi:phosphoribosylaminoimidazole (AIR) synthetase